MKSSTSTPGSIFAKIFPNRKQREQELAEQTAREIAKNSARFKREVIRTLQSIDFRNATFPEEVLKDENNPSPQYGNLERGVQVAVRALKKYGWSSENSPRPIEEPLRLLAQQFKEAVEHGNKRTAYRAKSYLLNGIWKIEDIDNYNNSPYMEELIELNGRWLEECCWVCQQETFLDELERSITENQKWAEELGNVEMPGNLSVEENRKRHLTELEWKKILLCELIKQKSEFLKRQEDILRQIERELCKPVMISADSESITQIDACYREKRKTVERNLEWIGRVKQIEESLCWLKRTQDMKEVKPLEEVEANAYLQRLKNAYWGPEIAEHLKKEIYELKERLEEEQE